MRLHLAREQRLALPGGGSIALAPRDAALLAWLAIEGPTPRQQLAELLWPDTEADAARNSLRQRLFKLHKRVGAELVAGGTTLALAAGLLHDLADADGVLGAAPTDSFVEGAFARWLETERERRRGRTRQALVARLEHAEAEGDWGLALEHAGEWLRLEPLSEEAHRRVMRLHYLAGDRAAALLAFDRCARMLDDEIGARPSAETLALLRTIGSAEAPAALPARGPVPAAVLRPPRMVGRERERQTLAEAWADRRPALVMGEGGLGKTRLLEELFAGRGDVLRAGARPGDEHVPFATAARLLRRLPPQALASARGAARSSLACLLPELGPPLALRDDADRARLFNAVAGLVGSRDAALAGCVVDDLHYADEASIELLRWLSGNEELAWLIASREAEAQGAARAWIEHLRGDARAPTVRLQPLQLHDVQALVLSLRVDAPHPVLDPAALLRRTGGNPLFLLETLKAGLLRSDGAGTAPRAGGIHELIGLRLQRLSPDALQLVRCAAMAGPDFSIELAAQVTGRRTLELADPWAELEAAQVFNDGAFAHDLIYEAARASVPAPVARRLHAEIAHLLQAAGGEPARIAEHWALAQHWPEAGHAYRAAATRAIAAGRDLASQDLLLSAADAFARAGDQPGRFDALLERADQLAGKEMGQLALQACDELARLAQSDMQRIEARAALLSMQAVRHEAAPFLAEVGPTIEQARAAGRNDLVFNLTMKWATALGHQRRPREAMAILDALRPWVLEQGDAEQRYNFEMECGLALDVLSRFTEARQAYARARVLAQERGRPDEVWMSMSNMASTLSREGLMEASVELYEQALRLAADIGDSSSLRLQQEHNGLAARLRDLGRYGRAIELLEPLLARFEAEGMVTDLALARTRLAMTYQFLGQAGRGHTLLAAPLEGVLPRVVAFYRALQADLALQMGGEGLAAAREALAMADDAGDVFHRTAHLMVARVLPAEEGEALAASVAHWAASAGRKGLAMHAHVRAAACAAAQQAWARAAGHADAALALAADTGPDLLYLPELWCVAARLALQRGRPDEARALVARGLAWRDEQLAAHVPEAFRDSFVHRNPVNRELALLSARLAVA